MNKNSLRYWTWDQAHGAWLHHELSLHLIHQARTNVIKIYFTHFFSYILIDWLQCLFSLLLVFFTPQGLLIAVHLPINYCEEPLYDLDDFNTVRKAVLNALVYKLLFLDCFNTQHVDGQGRNIYCRCLLNVITAECRRVSFIFKGLVCYECIFHLFFLTGCKVG